MIAIQFAINAQAQTQLSLEQAIALGLQQSKYLKLDSAKIEESTAKIKTQTVRWGVFQK